MTRPVTRTATRTERTALRTGSASLLGLLGGLLGLNGLAGLSLADVVHRTDGQSIEDVTVQEETLTEVSYQKGSDSGTVPAHQVARVDYASLPAELDEARAAFDSDDYGDALDLLEAYVDANVPRARAREKWAPAYAAWRAIAANNALGDLEGAVRAADRLIGNFADSRYFPLAYLAKADAQWTSGDGEAAQATLTELERMVSERGLAKRWSLEARVRLVRIDGRDPEAQRSSLGAIVSEAGSDFPAARDRARLAVGESLLAEAAEEKDFARAGKLREEAHTLFKGLVASPAADRTTRAGAHMGLGECLFFRGLDTKEAAVFREASLHFLRVPVSHRDEPVYMPKALFYSMRCFDLMGDKRRTRDLKAELQSLYPDSTWAEESARFGG